MQVTGRQRNPAAHMYAPHIYVRWLALPFLLLPVSCSSMAVEDEIPMSRQTVSAGPARPTQPDGYPNLNIPHQAASPQLDNAERKRLSTELTALRESQQVGSDSSPALSQADRLRLLARSRDEDVLRGIEASQ